MNGGEIQVRQGSVMPFQQGRLQVAFVNSTAIYGTQGEFPRSQQDVEARKQETFLYNTTCFPKTQFLAKKQ